MNARLYKMRSLRGTLRGSPDRSPDKYGSFSSRARIDKQRKGYN